MLGKPKLTEQLALFYCLRMGILVGFFISSIDRQFFFFEQMNLI